MIKYLKVISNWSKNKKEKKRIGATQKKILLLLFGGIALGLSGSPRTYFKIIRGMREEWKRINEANFKRSVKTLYESKLVSIKPSKNGGVVLVLSEAGHERALAYNLETLKLKIPRKWDKKWRIIIFDVPERLKEAREALRFHLRGIGFLELQKSVYIHPADCRDEIEYLIEFHDMRKFVRFIVADSIDNELHLKHLFGL